MEPETRSRASKALALVGWLAFAAVVGPAAVAATARWTVIGELASQFLWFIGLAGLLLAAVEFVLGRWVRFGVLAVIGLWAAWPETSLWFASPEEDPGTPSLLIACTNVYRPNDNYSSVLDGMDHHEPDVIGIMEVSPEWREAALRILGKEYPYHAEGLDTSDWNGSTWGLMLFSRHPLEEVLVHEMWNDGRRLRPIVEAVVALGDERVTIQLAHPQRPGRGWRLSDRKVAFARMSALPPTGHRVLVGDLNTTSTSPLFRDLLRDGGLRDSRAGFGRLPTWELAFLGVHPLWFKALRALPKPVRPSVSIDHALVSEGLVVTERTTRSTRGSDHRGVLVRVALRH